MPIALHIALAQPSDALAIADMSRRLIEQGLPWTWRPRRVAGAISAPNTNVAVVRERTELLAFGIMEYWDEDAHLVLFAVEPTYQRQGIETALLRWLEVSAMACGSHRIRLEARRDNEAARLFYNEHGYHEVHLKERMYSGALDGIRLEKWPRPKSDA